MSNNNITIPKLSETLSLNQSTEEKKIAELKNAGMLKRVGSNKTGYWEIVERSV